MNIKIYYIDDEYIDYLREFDTKVPYNKNRTRPYVGIVYTYQNNNYFAPLSSPKEKHLKMSDKAIDIYKIANGTLGIININNMLPTPIECLTEALPTITDEIYKTLLKKQITYINDNKNDLLSKVNQFQLRYRKGFLPKGVLERCCDFQLLEEKCKEWEKIHSQIILGQEDLQQEDETETEDEDEPEM